jgi:hypothetical protein
MLPVDTSEVQRQESKWSSRSALLLTDSRSAKGDNGLEIGRVADYHWPDARRHFAY